MRAPQPQRTGGVCMGRGDSPSRNWNTLQNARFAESRFFLDGQRGEPDRRRPGGTDAQEVLLPHFSLATSERAQSLQSLQSRYSLIVNSFRHGIHIRP